MREAEPLPSADVLNSILSKMTEESENLRARSFLLENEVDLKFKDRRLGTKDCVDDSNELFLIAMNHVGKELLAQQLRTRLRQKKNAINDNDYNFTGPRIHSTASALVTDMLATLERLIAAMEELGEWRVATRF